MGKKDASGSNFANVQDKHRRQLGKHEQKQTKVARREVDGRKRAATNAFKMPQYCWIYVGLLFLLGFAVVFYTYVLTGMLPTAKAPITSSRNRI